MREALKKMKAKKGDSVFDAATDFYINGPEELIEHLTTLIIPA